MRAKSNRYGVSAIIKSVRARILESRRSIARSYTYRKPPLVVREEGREPGSNFGLGLCSLSPVVVLLLLLPSFPELELAKEGQKREFV